MKKKASKKNDTAAKAATNEGKAQARPGAKKPGKSSGGDETTIVNCVPNRRSAGVPGKKGEQGVANCVPNIRRKKKKSSKRKSD